MKIIADTHCHTTASTHAYSSLEEMVKAAQKKNLYAIAITDHGRLMPGAPGQWYFENLRIIPKKIDGVRVIKGIEANVCDYDGNLDVEDSSLGYLEWVIASMHEITLEPICDIDACTAAWLNVAKNPYVDVIGHSGVKAFKFDYEKVIPEFGRYGKLVEINNNSFIIRKSGIENCKKIAQICKKHGVRIVVNSDAHFSSQVGIFDNAISLLKEIDFPEDLVVNSDIDRFKSYLKSRPKTALIHNKN
ncbi:MAG: putative phosphatase YcdX [Eubacteriales bacterium SKADARSKE-1]|nr:putative phosphatase YcdX [Eubacteriales bacterium SKADARSKE-1]